ncbi:acid phosphatase [Tumebacillus sp. ITR2]|uniref:Acid phosphatase n=1 Tax=Tumebacillus amylolyticus TaxID=2801339 RepID=A0ABS1J6S0_9BACL|nr:alkaline phosphatase family protein [Tumebacillus amylolyticus]MBL0385977.1 acid phosphatase [Tumebacillus amylolyticus]
MKKAFALIAALTAVTAVGATVNQPQTATAAGTVPRPDHVIVVMEENHSYSEVIGNTTEAPYINSLKTLGASFSDSHGVEHPSQPNYFDLFSGTNHSVTSDTCPHTFTTPSLASQLIGAGLTFGGYSEDLPYTGFTGCSNLKYYRKHAPWVNFSNLPTSINMPFTSFPTDFTKLPTISFVIPNQDHDMHDGTINQADTWLKTNLDSYVQWAKTHNSLLIVQWDEDDFGTSNQIPTLFVGPMVKAGSYSENINHFNVLRTLEDMYALPTVSKSTTATPITDVWN